VGVCLASQVADNTSKIDKFKNLYASKTVMDAEVKAMKAALNKQLGDMKASYDKTKLELDALLAKKADKSMVPSADAFGTGGSTYMPGDGKNAHPSAEPRLSTLAGVAAVTISIKDRVSNIFVWPTFQSGEVTTTDPKTLPSYTRPSTKYPDMVLTTSRETTTEKWPVPFASSRREDSV